MDWVLMLAILSGALPTVGMFILEEGTLSAHDDLAKALISIGSMASMATIFTLTEYCKNKRKVYEGELVRLQKLKKVSPHDSKSEWEQRERQYQEEICSLKSQMKSIQELINLLTPSEGVAQ